MRFTILILVALTFVACSDDDGPKLAGCLQAKLNNLDNPSNDTMIEYEYNGQRYFEINDNDEFTNVIEVYTANCEFYCNSRISSLPFTDDCTSEYQQGKVQIKQWYPN